MAIQELIFPENSGAIIGDLLKIYGLNEAQDVLMEKIKNNEPTSGNKLARIVNIAVEQNKTIQDIIDLVKAGLLVSDEVAGKIAQELKTQIVDLALPAGEIIKQERQIKQKIKKELDDISVHQADTYREQVEE